MLMKYYEGDNGANLSHGAGMIMLNITRTVNFRLCTYNNSFGQGQRKGCRHVFVDQKS